MNSIFGDATTAAPTPQTLAEAESLFSRSPVPSFRLADGADGPAPQDANIPDLDIDPPAVEIENGKPMYTKHRGSDAQSEGLGGWISNLVKKGGKSDGGAGSSIGGAGGSGKYRQIGQDDD